MDAYEKQRQRDRVKSLLKAVSNSRAWQALVFIADNGESTIIHIRSGINASTETVQQLMIDLHRQGLVRRRTPGAKHGNAGRQPFYYALSKPVAVWLGQTEKLAQKIKEA